MDVCRMMGSLVSPYWWAARRKTVVGFGKRSVMITSGFAFEMRSACGVASAVSAVISSSATGVMPYSFSLFITPSYLACPHASCWAMMAIRSAFGMLRAKSAWSTPS